MAGESSNSMNLLVQKQAGCGTPHNACHQQTLLVKQSSPPSAPVLHNIFSGSPPAWMLGKIMVT
jgi:hypothetical protein